MRFKNKKTGSILEPTSKFVIEQMKKHTDIYELVDAKGKAKVNKKETEPITELTEETGNLDNTADTE